MVSFDILIVGTVLRVCYIDLAACMPVGQRQHSAAAAMRGESLSSHSPQDAISWPTTARGQQRSARLAEYFYEISRLRW